MAGLHKVARRQCNRAHVTWTGLTVSFWVFLHFLTGAGIYSGSGTASGDGGSSSSCAQDCSSRRS